MPACFVLLATVARLLAWLAALSRVVAVYLAVYDDSHAAVAFDELADAALGLSGPVRPQLLALRAVRGASDKDHIA